MDHSKINPNDAGNYSGSHLEGNHSAGQNALGLDGSVIWYKWSDRRMTNYQDGWDR